MTLRRMQVTDFRCLPSAGLEFDPAFTLIFGANASGKTSLLEAIYVLGRGRSFRTRLSEHLIRHGTDRFVVFGEVDAGGRIPLGVEGSDEGVRARIQGEKPANSGAAGIAAACADHRSRSSSVDRRRPEPATTFHGLGRVPRGT